MGADLGADDGLEVDQVLVDADLEDAANAVARLVHRVLVHPAGVPATQPHLPRGLGHHLVGDPAAGGAGEVLIDLVGRAGVAALHEMGVVAPTPGTATIAGGTVVRVGRVDRRHGVGLR